jgi:hypothetical protein
LFLQETKSSTTIHFRLGLAKEQFKSYDSFFFSSGKLRHLKRKRKESEKPKTFIGSWGPLGNSSSYCLAQSGMTELPESHGQDNHFRPQHNIKKLQLI